MREYDVYLRQRLTEADVIIRSIPLRDGISVTNRIMLETMLRYYTLQKFVAARMESALVTEIDGVLSRIFSLIGQETELRIDAEFAARYKNELERNGIELSLDDVAGYLHGFLAVSDAMALTLSDIETGTKVSLGEGENRIGLESLCRGDVKRAMERASSALSILSSEPDTAKKTAETVYSGLLLDSGEFPLFYRLSCGVEAAFSIAVDIAEIELHYSLGSGEDAIVLAASTADTAAVKSIEVADAIVLFASASAALRYFFALDDSIAITTSASAAIRRLRALSEVDGDTLADIDGMTLDELYYVELS